MARFVRFLTAEGAIVALNPHFVAALVPTHPPRSRMEWCEIRSSGGAFIVCATVEQVARKLEDNS